MKKIYLKEGQKIVDIEGNTWETEKNDSIVERNINIIEKNRLEVDDAMPILEQIQDITKQDLFLDLIKEFGQTILVSYFYTSKKKYEEQGIEENTAVHDAFIDMLDFGKYLRAEQKILEYEKEYGEDFVQEQITKGMDVEKEHSEDEMVQYRIAVEHLAENINYYQALDVMEKELQK